MKSSLYAIVFAAAVLTTSSASAAVACQTPFGVVPIPQFTYFAGVPCTNGYVSGFTVILPPPQGFVPPMHDMQLHAPAPHAAHPGSQGRRWRDADRGQPDQPRAPRRGDGRGRH